MITLVAWACLVAGYALLLLVITWGFKLIVHRAVGHAIEKHLGRFRYQAEHDAWVCPQGQWLWSTSPDPDNQVCNNCPIKPTPTTFNYSRETIPSPNFDADQRPRDLFWVITTLGLVVPLAILFANHTVANMLVFGITASRARN